MAEKSSVSVARASTLMAFTTTLSRLTGFLKWLAITYALGRTVTADAYNLANNLPNMIYELIVGGVVTAAFIPVIMDHLSKGDEEEGWRVASLIMNFVFLILILVSLIGVLFPYPFVRIQMLLVSPERQSLSSFSFAFLLCKSFSTDFVLLLQAFSIPRIISSLPPLLLSLIILLL